MKNYRFPAGALAAVLAAAGGFAQTSPESPVPERPAKAVAGSIQGTTRGPAGRPLPEVQILIQEADATARHFAISGPDGAFAVVNLKPGRYQLIASKDGFLTSSAAVQLKPYETLQMALALSSRHAADEDGPAAGQQAGALAAIEERLKRLEALDARITRLEAIDARIARLEAIDARITRLEAELNPTKPAPAAAAALPPPVAPTTVEAVPAANHAPGPLYASLSAPALASVAIPAARPPAPTTPAAGGGSSGVAAPAPPAASPTPAPQEPAPASPAVPPPPAADHMTPFADHDWTWLNGNPRNRDTAFDTKFFTPEIRADLNYTFDFNRPKDDSMGGSSELFRSNEIQLVQLGVGGDFHWDNVRARIMTQFGAYSTTTPRNDASYAKGQWDLSNAYRYVSEAYGGYHLNALHGINLDAGIFMSYVGLFSYYNFDNWAYQPSYVSSNTPWFFEGIRIQIFPTQHLKIEPWIINGWQSYASANARKGLGGQIKWTPFPWMNIISNNYALGHDDLYLPNRGRIHTDDSLEIKYYDRPSKTLDKMAFTFTGDLGCEFGGGVSCHGNTRNGPKQSFVGFMLYNRWWFDRDLYAFTLGGGMINNPGRYLVLLPPINGMSASSAAVNSPYFTENPGDPFKAWDVSGTFDYMPKQWLTFRFEGDFRHANVPYWSGAGGITPPPGSNNGFPTQYACMNGAASGQMALSAAGVACAPYGGVWSPDLRHREFLLDIDLLVKF